MDLNIRISTEVQSSSTIIEAVGYTLEGEEYEYGKDEQDEATQQYMG